MSFFHSVKVFWRILTANPTSFLLHGSTTVQIKKLLAVRNMEDPV